MKFSVFETKIPRTMKIIWVLTYNLDIKHFKCAPKLTITVNYYY